MLLILRLFRLLGLLRQAPREQRDSDTTGQLVQLRPTALGQRAEPSPAQPSRAEPSPGNQIGQSVEIAWWLGPVARADELSRDEWFVLGASLASDARRSWSPLSRSEVRA